MLRRRMKVPLYTPMDFSCAPRPFSASSAIQGFLAVQGHEILKRGERRKKTRRARRPPCSISRPAAAEAKPLTASRSRWIMETLPPRSTARTPASGAGYRGSNPWGAATIFYFFSVGAAGRAGDGGVTALSSQAVYQRFKSICDPAARRCVVNSNASGDPFSRKPPAFSSA